MDASVALHLETIYHLGKEQYNGFTPLGAIVSHINDIITIQERRISTLEAEIAEMKREAPNG